MTKSINLSFVEHRANAGVHCRYWKALREQEFEVTKDTPTLIWPIVSGSIPHLKTAVSKNPWFVIASKPQKFIFFAEFVEFLVIQFADPIRFEALSDNQSVLPGFCWPKDITTEFGPTDWLKAVLKRYVFERITCASSQTNCTFFLEKQILNEVLNIVFRSYESRSYFTSKVDEPNSKNYELQRWVAFLKSNIHRTVSLKELEAFAGISVSELSRVFKREIGTSPISFHKRARLEEAKNLIDDGKLSVNTAAHVFGYSDAVSFRHAFKRAFGVSPKSQ